MMPRPSFVTVWIKVYSVVAYKAPAFLKPEVMLKTRVVFSRQ